MKKLRLIILSLILACSCMAGNLGLDTVVATTDGTVRQGARQVIMVFSSDYSGTVNGVAYNWAAGGSINLSAPSNDTVYTITYTVAAGNITIIRLQ